MCIPSNVLVKSEGIKVYYCKFMQIVQYEYEYI